MNHLLHFVTALFLLFQFYGTPVSKPRFAATAAPAADVEDAQFIPWLSERRLNWNDFQCEPVRNTDAVALTSTSLGLSYKVVDDEFVYDITCKFAKTRSWGLLRTDYILAHEQAHFDITELFARKLHKELQAYRFSRKTFKKDVNTIYEKVVREKELFQELYDGQTDHSRKKGKQEQWLLRIENLMLDSEAFSNYP